MLEQRKPEFAVVERAAELAKAIAAAETVTALEDIYRPFRPKKRTRATIAKEKGLAPLADLIFAQDPAVDPGKAAAEYVGREYVAEDGKNRKSKIESVAEALAGARDIIAERVSDDKNARARLRTRFQHGATISTKVIAGKEAEAAKFKDYFRLERAAGQGAFAPRAPQLLQGDWFASALNKKH